MPVYQTDILEAPLVDPNQTGTKDTHNDGLNALANAQGKVLEIDLSVESSPYTIPYSALEGGDKTALHFRILRTIGVIGASFQVIVPDREHEFLFDNRCDDNVTVSTLAGEGAINVPNEISICYCDATDVVKYALGGAVFISGLDSADIGTISGDGNVTLSGGGTLQSVTLEDGMVVLPTDQTDGTENRPWVVNTGGAWTPLTGWDTPDTVEAGASFVIGNGDNVGKIFRLETTGTITIGTTVLSWNTEAYQYVSRLTPLSTNAAAITLDNSYDDKHIFLTRNGTQDCTIPTNAVSPRSAGAGFRVQAHGTGTKTVQGDTGVTVNGVSGGSIVIGNQFDCYEFIKKSGNTWDAIPMSTAAAGAVLLASNNTWTGTNYFSQEPTLFGPASADIVLDGANTFSQMSSNDAALWGLVYLQYGASAAGANIGFAKTRNASPTGGTTVNDDDLLLDFWSYGDDGTNYIATARMAVKVQGTPATGIIPSSIIFSTMNTSGTFAQKYAIGPAGELQIGASEDAGTAGQFIMSGGSAATTAWKDFLVLLPFIIDGGGSVIATGIKGDIGPFDYDAVIVANTLLADQTGSIVIDIWKDSYANFPPTVADTITAAAKPTLSSAEKSQDSTLTGWTTSISAGDILRINVDSVSAVTRITLALKIRRVA